jgi:hypothetical protein
MKIQSIRANSYVNNFSGKPVKLAPAHVYAVVEKPSVQIDFYEKALRKIEDKFMTLAVKTRRISVGDIVTCITKPRGEGYLGLLLVNKKAPANTHGVDFAGYFDRIVSDKKNTIKLELPVEEEAVMMTGKLAIAS